MLGNLMNALMQPGAGGQQSAGASMLSSVVGGLMGGGQQGSAPVNQLLGGLEQVIGGNPTSGQPLSGGTAPAANSPLMGLLGPIATAVAGKTGIPPAVATTVAATAMHYLISSHPAAGGTAPLNLNNVAQQMASGSVSQQTLQSSGMVNAVVQATGLSQQDAAKSLDATFAHLQTHVRNVKSGDQRAEARGKSER
jgi:hypothetical protein